MPIVGNDSPAPAPTAGQGQGMNPTQKLQKILKEIEQCEIVAQFVGKDKRVKVDTTYLDMALGEYTQITQSPQVYNKFLQADTKLEKSLKEYASTIRLLLASTTQLGNAQAMIADQAPDVAATPGNPSPVDSGMAPDNGQVLPTK